MQRERSFTRRAEIAALGPATGHQPRVVRIVINRAQWVGSALFPGECKKLLQRHPNRARFLCGRLPPEQRIRGETQWTMVPPGRRLKGTPMRDAGLGRRRI